MDLDTFIRVTRGHILEYFALLQRASAAGAIRNVETGATVEVLFPTALLITETPTHYCADLLGASEHFSLSLETIFRTSSSMNEVLGSFHAPQTGGPFILPAGVGDVMLETMTLLSGRTRPLFEARYPDFSGKHLSSITSDVPLEPDEAFSPLNFNEGFRDLWLRDVLVVNDWRGIVRARYFQAFWMIEREATPEQYRARLRNKHPIGQARMALLPPAANENGRSFVTAASFATLSGLQDVGETTITRFIEKHGSILTHALGGARVIPQPKFPWIEGNPDPEEEWIQPDFLLVEEDGRAHICEVKLPLLGERNVTAGRHRRRRFKLPVADGLAQLANYDDYFQQPAHRTFLEEREIYMDRPRRILIVGSDENFIADEVREAMRMLTDFEILDYDSLRVLYAAASTRKDE